MFGSLGTVVAPAHLGELARGAIGEYSPQFPLRLMNNRMPATEAAFEASNSGLVTEGDDDFSAMVRYLERRNVASHSARAV
jgi:hypothetical protein